jgi:hypothetical protein
MLNATRRHNTLSGSRFRPGPSRRRLGQTSSSLLILVGGILLGGILALYVLRLPAGLVLAQPDKVEKDKGRANDKKEAGPDADKKEAGAESDGYLKTNLQDVSSVFTYHLTALGLMFVAATILLAIQQANAQKQDAKRNEERAAEQAKRDADQARKTQEWQEQQARRDEEQNRLAKARQEEEAKRDKSIRQALVHTSTLIKHMSGVMQATEKTLRSTNDVRKMLAKFRREILKGKEQLRHNSVEFIQRYSLNDPSFAQQVRAAHDETVPWVSKVPSDECPVEYHVLDALYWGAGLGKSRQALEILDRSVTPEKVTDRDLLARTHYFRGHFCLRIGKFPDALDHFKKGRELKRDNDSYRLFELYSELMDLRQKGDATADEPIRKAFEEYWNEKIRTPTNPNVRPAALPYFWEHLGLSYGGLLVEGLCPAADPLRGDPQVARKRLELAWEVAEQGDARAHSPVFDVVRFEVGMRLARLGDGSKLMDKAGLRQVIERCQTAATSPDDRAQIVYTTRLARFYGRLAAALPTDSYEEREARGEMESLKLLAVQMLRTFQQQSGKDECVFSVFSNLYQPPNLIIQDIETAITPDNYRQERQLALEGIARGT